MNIADGIRNHCGIYGLRGIFLAAKARILGRPVETTMRAPGLRHPVQLRVRTSDGRVFEDVIRHAQYDIELPFTPKTIVDAGANVGMASVFYANKYPDARIIALEPEAENFRMLLRNVAPYPNIVPVNAAVWSEDRYVSMTAPSGVSAAFRVADCNGETPVQAFSIPTIMKQHGLQSIDLLKVDIEGAEKEVFDSAQPWIESVGAVVIELHDRFKAGCGKSLFMATQNFEEECSRGELTILINNRMRLPRSGALLG